MILAHPKKNSIHITISDCAATFQGNMYGWKKKL